MEFIVVMIGIAIVVVLVLAALFFGLIGTVAHGPKPSEGKKDTG